MSMMDTVLEKLGLKFEELKYYERDQLLEWEKALAGNELTVEKIKGYVTSMRSSVENELVKVDNGYEKDSYLKARLANYILLEALLSSPEKAREALERTLAGMVSNKNII